jgi:nitroreductase
MGPPQWSDLGMYVQTVMLLARAHGLDSCGIEAWTFWRKTAAAFLALPAEEMVFCGMALGHADPDAPINRWRSSREAIALPFSPAFPTPRCRSVDAVCG